MSEQGHGTVIEAWLHCAARPALRHDHNADDRLAPPTTER